ncbi:MAG TPA: mechanosensitive ion channel family protein [Casimicrobiaceae bacterium]|nr:mechanosensitive ion channel family protein [Casimicrobiaceae bacterium]
MPIESHLNEALPFAGLALVLALIALFLRSPARQTMLVMLVVIAVGMIGLAVYERQLFGPSNRSLAVVVREAALALIALGVIQIVVLFLFQALLVRRRLPRILNEFVVALALIGYAIYRLDAVGVNLAGLITTSAVVSGALAFSAKETLGNLWGGIAIQLEKTCRIGDWVRIDTVTGQVVSIRWRYMAIATINNETIVIPNGTVMQNRLTVISRRGEERAPWRRFVPFEVDFDHPPSRVIAQLESALAHAQIPFVSQQPPPTVGCIGFKESGVEYAVAYELTEAARYWEVDSAVRVHVYAALMRQSLGIPFPRHVIEVRQDERPGHAQREIDHRIAALSTMDLFASLTDAERATLARKLTTCAYVPDEMVCRAGEPADSLFLLAQGQVAIVAEDNGARHRLATLDAPAYFGEMGLLLGQPRGATVVAAGDALCYRLDKDAFDATIRARPELADMLAHVLAMRQAANDATLQALDVHRASEEHLTRRAEIVRRIQQFFGLSH